jgi:hypothetical protein
VSTTETPVAEAEDSLQELIHLTTEIQRREFLDHHAESARHNRIEPRKRHRLAVRTQLCFIGAREASHGALGLASWLQFRPAAFAR